MKLKHLFAILLCCLAISATAATPKYVFYFIGDGMGPGQTMTTANYYRMALGDTAGLPMMSLPVNSYVTTHSYSSPVTDSAAAGTALSTGHKTRNGMIGMSADTTVVYSVAKKFHDAGYGVGIITTTAADDATPSSFYAHVPNRNMFYEIGRQAGESGYEVIGGASLRGTNGGNNDLMSYIESCGVEVVKGIEAMRKSDSRRVLLLPDVYVDNNDIGYAVDSIAGALTLEQMTSATIDHLMKHTPEGFFIMAEGGSIDHACHSNDGGTAIRETIAFNEAISRAIDFYKERPDETLIVITADHETGGMTVGNGHTGYNYYPQYLVPQKASKSSFSRYCDKLTHDKTPITWEEMKQVLTDTFGFYTVVPISDGDDKRLQQAFRKAFIEGSDERTESLYSNIGSFSNEVFDMLNRIAGVGWISGSHSGNYVPLFAIGVGSELFMGQNDNTRVPVKILKAAQLDD